MDGGAPHRTDGELGPLGERLAREWLLARGWRIETTDFRKGRHQADILARDGRRAVVVEVKSRRHPGRPEAGLTPAQGRRLLALAREWFGEEEPLPRLDLVTVRFMDREPPRIDHFPDLLLFN